MIERGRFTDRCLFLKKILTTLIIVFACINKTTIIILTFFAFNIYSYLLRILIIINTFTLFCLKASNRSSNKPRSSINLNSISNFNSVKNYFSPTCFRNSNNYSINPKDCYNALSQLRLDNFSNLPGEKIISKLSRSCLLKISSQTSVNSNNFGSRPSWNQTSNLLIRHSYSADIFGPVGLITSMCPNQGGTMLVKGQGGRDIVLQVGCIKNNRS
ncbi:expressed protein [Phakopsora pachyrhizi]|uniref:Expressed protein n=1 Tax=Phakopsora pachyrhizi TaxID=170000 RepID=A0AAV0BLM8_PHAPC|nr:expressed protein [Phakopsora pachyrhizi]